MEFFVIYLILTSTISVLAILFAILLVILFAFNRISKENIRAKVEVEALNLFKVSTEFDRTSPNEKVHKNKK